MMRKVAGLPHAMPWPLCACPSLQRFRRRTEFGDSDSEDEGEEWAPEGQDAGSDGECEVSAAFKCFFGWEDLGLVSCLLIKFWFGH